MVLVSDDKRSQATRDSTVQPLRRVFLCSTVRSFRKSSKPETQIKSCLSLRSLKFHQKLEPEQLGVYDICCIAHFLVQPGVPRLTHRTCSAALWSRSNLDRLRFRLPAPDKKISLSKKCSVEN